MPEITQHLCDNAQSRDTGLQSQMTDMQVRDTLNLLKAQLQEVQQEGSGSWNIEEKNLFHINFIYITVLLKWRCISLKTALPALKQHLPNYVKYTNLFICMCPIEFMNVKVFQIKMQLLLAQFTSCHCFQRRTWWGSGQGENSVSSFNIRHGHINIKNSTQFFGFTLQSNVRRKENL